MIAPRADAAGDAHVRAANCLFPEGRPMRRVILFSREQFIYKADTFIRSRVLQEPPGLGCRRDHPCDIEIHAPEKGYIAAHGRWVIGLLPAGPEEANEIGRA